MSKRLIIAIDCDDALIETTRFLVDTYNSLYGASVTLENAHSSHNPEWQSTDRQEVYRRIRSIQMSDEFGELAPTQAAVDAVHRLAANHELHLVTARHDEVAAVTHRMLGRYFKGCFTGIEHAGPDRPKGEICASLKADMMIDDNLLYLESVVMGCTTHPIWFGDYPWQKEHSETTLPVQRCRTWQEVEDAVTKYS